MTQKRKGESGDSPSLCHHSEVNHVILLSLSISSKRAQARFFNAVIYLSSKKDSEKRTEAMASLQ